MKIAITGSSGFIGTAVQAHLKNQGHDILPIVRSAIQGNHIEWNPDKGTIDSAALDDAHVDVVIHLAGVGIAEKKWSDSQKKAIMDSRVKGTRLLSETLAGLTNKPKQLISSSAIGFYGSRGDEVLDENSARGTGFLSDVCVAWEEETAPAREAGIAVAIVRTGIVLDSSGGTLGQMLLPFKLGAGGRIGDGKQYMSWISLPDHLAATTFIMDNTLSGTFNLVAPNPVTNNEFTKSLGERLSRPTILPTPLFPLKLKFGSELVEALLLGSQRVTPAALQKAGFTFRHSTLPDALKEVV
jgi:uncharacterized protein (TIGR01777 family)